MKHVKDAKNLVDAGDGEGALAILDNLLSLAPRNFEALRLKAEILDAWGRFDDSLKTLHHLAQQRNLDEQSVHALEKRALEEKESMVFSELSSEGRWYFAFPTAQVWISLMGFIGCAAFLLLAPQLLTEGMDRFFEMSFAFGFLVVLPWLGLIALHVFGIKKVLVGIGGLRISRRFSEKTIPWSQIGSVTLEYDKDPKSGHLQLLVYSVEANLPPILSLDVSKSKSVVKARRHFVRNVLSYAGIVAYISRNEARTHSQNTHKPIAAEPLVPNTQAEKAENTDRTA